MKLGEEMIGEYMASCRIKVEPHRKFAAIRSAWQNQNILYSLGYDHRVHPDGDLVQP